MTYTYTIDEIKTMYSDGKFTRGYHNESLRRLPDDYVFSENLTIKENRDRIRQHNQEVDQTIRDWQKDQNELTLYMRSLVRDAMVEYYSMNEQQAEIVEEHCWSEYHHCVSDYLCEADIAGELIEEVLEASK